MAGMLGDIAHVLTSLPVQLLVAFAVLAAVTVATGGFAFWLSRPGNIVLAVVVTFIVTHDLTHRLDGAEALGAETASQAATIRELRRDAFATQSVATAAAAREQAAAANARDLQQKVDAYEKDVATRAKSSACLLGDDDARRLRGIGGSPRD